MKRTARIARSYLAEALSVNQSLTLDKRASHHLSTVLRLNTGSRIILFNGDGNDYLAEVIQSGKQTIVQIVQQLPVLSESPVSITLIQAVSRSDRMDATVRQSVELGAVRICPVYSRHSIAPLDTARAVKKHAHWKNILISASEQSGRSLLPDIGMPQSLADCLLHFSKSTNNEQQRRIVLAPVAISGLLQDRPEIDANANASVQAPPKVIPPQHLQEHSILLIAGPESGLDEDELQLAEDAGFIRTQLGPRILRTETAGPAAIASLQTLYGDFA
ncbi:MAG: 16S rRNA (uracil(1498)-N(3))-methyltransferase [Granulosicoccus sp.]